ncbi:hypothetical protein [Sphingomonas sp.]|uniref:hypothetical protein n=1 Tax=Sphingomonas sp. TaxID=28214 RepID=UPI002DD65BCA|nr:hypothetical protein [Sphingomonas sp.]
MIGRTGLAGLALTLVGCATTPPDYAANDAAELADAVKGRIAGQPVRCLPSSSTDAPRIIGESLLYRDGRRLLLSEAMDGCPSLRGDPIVIVEVRGGQVCSGDSFRTLPRGGSIPGPTCRFGPFVPYTLPR